MIRLIRDDGIEMLVNTEFITDVQQFAPHETVISLTNGEKITVKTSKWDVMEKMRAYRMGINSERKGVFKKGKPETKKGVN